MNGTRRSICDVLGYIAVSAALAGGLSGIQPAPAAAAPPPGAKALLGTWEWRDLDETLSPRGEADRVHFVHRNGRIVARFPLGARARVAWRPRHRSFAFSVARPSGKRGAKRVKVLYRGRVDRGKPSIATLRGAVKIRGVAGTSAFRAERPRSRAR